MDYRKLIKFGDNSFVVSLPKEWLKKNQLEKGNVVYLSENGSNQIVLSPQEKEDLYTERSIFLDVSQEPDFQSIIRRLYSKYIAGYDRITLSGEKMIREHGEKIRLLLTDFLAFEIIEETKHKIVLKDYIDARIVSLETTLRRVDILLRSMLSDLEHIYEDNAVSFNRRDKEINRQTLFAIRIINKAVTNPSLQLKLDLKQDRLLRIWDLFNTLECFADELKQIAHFLEKSKTNKRGISTFFKLFDHVVENYKMAMKAWYAQDEKLAYEVANNVTSFIGECNGHTNSQKSLYLSLAIWKLKAMENFIKNITRGIYGT